MTLTNILKAFAQDFRVIRTAFASSMLSLVCAVSLAQAAPLTWTNGNGTGLASDPLNWSSGTVPSALDDVILNGTSTANITWDGQTGVMPQTVSSWTQTAAYTGTVNFQTTYTGANSNGFNTFTITNDANLSGGVWTHEVNGLGFSAANPNQYRLRIDVGGDLTLASTGTINVDSKGYLRNSPNFNGGGSHGGRSQGGGASYGSIFQPQLHGKGAGAATNPPNQDGGGSVYLTVGGQATLNGNIFASVTNVGGSFNRAAAGGSLYLEAGSLAGSGTLSVKGGNTNGGSNTTSGAGGRLAVILNDSGADFSSFSGIFNASAGSNNGGLSQAPAGGSIYLREGDQTSGQGTVLIDFFNFHGDLVDDHTHVLTSENLSQASVVLARSAHLRIDLTKTIGSLTGDNTSNLTIDASRVLTTGGNNASTTMSGVVRGAGSLLKSGTGAMTLDAANVYSGGTTVSDGTLLVNNLSGSGTGSGAVTVEDGAILGGNGVLDGLTTIESGATLAPGTSPGTLTFNGGLTLEDGSIVEFELGSTSDLIVISGGNFTGSASANGIGLFLTELPGFSGVKTLFDWTDATALDLETTDFYFLPGSLTGDLEFVGSTLQFTVPIPEPSSSMLLAIGCCCAMFRRRRRLADQRKHQVSMQ